MDVRPMGFSGKDSNNKRVIILHNIQDCDTIKATLAWERLLIEDRRIVTSEELHELAGTLSRDGTRVIDYLQHNGYIARVIRGIFYVRSFEERKRKRMDVGIHRIIASALERKGVRNWYFGLETALKMNGMTHEYFTVDYVLTDSYRTTKVICIMGMRFQFIKRSPEHFRRGVARQNGMRVSDREKTVLDIAYRSFLRKEPPEGPIAEYGDGCDRAKLAQYLKYYPKSFRARVADSL